MRNSMLQSVDLKCFQLKERVAEAGSLVGSRW